VRPLGHLLIWSLRLGSVNTEIKGFAGNYQKENGSKTVSKFIFFNLFAVFFNLFAAIFNLFVSFFNLFVAFFNLFGAFLNLFVPSFNLSASFLNLFAAFFSVLSQTFEGLSGEKNRGRLKSHHKVAKATARLFRQSPI